MKPTQLTRAQQPQIGLSQIQQPQIELPQIGLSQIQARVAQLAPLPSKPGRLKPPGLRDAEAMLAKLKEIAREMRIYSTRHAIRGRLTGPQLNVLEALAEEEAQSITALGEQLGFDRNTVAGIVRRLEVRRLAVRLTSSSDRRATRVSLTKEGRRVLAGQAVLWPEATLAEALSRTPLGLRRRVLEGLEAMRQLLAVQNANAAASTYHPNRRGSARKSAGLHRPDQMTGLSRQND